MDPSVPPKLPSMPAAAPQPEVRSPLAAGPTPSAAPPTAAAASPATTAPPALTPYAAATVPSPGPAAPLPPPSPFSTTWPPGLGTETIFSPAAAAPPAVGLPNPADASASGNPELHAKIVATLKTIYDPEIPVNLWDMGLIYGIAIEPTGAVGIVMTLTSPWCPEAGVLPPQIESAVKGIPGVTNAKVAIVWEPPWDPSRMSEAARLQLGMM